MIDTQYSLKSALMWKKMEQKKGGRVRLRGPALLGLHRERRRAATGAGRRATGKHCVRRRPAHQHVRRLESTVSNALMYTKYSAKHPPLHYYEYSIYNTSFFARGQRAFKLVVKLSIYNTMCQTPFFALNIVLNALIYTIQSTPKAVGCVAL